MRLLWMVAVLTACGPAGRDPSGTPDAAPADAGGGQDGPITPTSARVYAHSGGTLYAMNPATLSATPIGPMAGLDTNRSLLDLAVDKNGGMVGVSREKLYRINVSTGALTLINELATEAQNFTSLSYAPSDPNDPNSVEMLISANDAGDVFKIDISGVQAVPILMGNYGTHNGQQIRSSGDLVSVTGFGIYATVDIGDDRDAPDYLVKLDPTNGWRATVLPQQVSTGYNRLFGLGFWGGTFYGFADNGTDGNGASLGGRMIQIDPTTGAGTNLSSADIRWYGAGVTTSAPIL